MPATLNNDLYIIAIGASAGGIQAVRTLLDYTLEDSVAYVIIMHLFPDYKSRLKEVIQQHSELEIIEATHGMRIESNKIYVIPTNKVMTMKNHVLNLESRENPKYPNKTIDAFFISLAQEIGNKAIGIILSGMLNDGTKGIEAISKAGGMIIIQDPATSQFDDMPNNAIASNYADYILPPELMPQQILSYIRSLKKQAN
jgi:two-component system, chemotaxis family, CheB/CheR fusion protein